MFGRDPTSAPGEDTIHMWARARARRARRRERERAEAEQISDVRWHWRIAASSALGRMIYTPSGVATTVPLIDRIDLGPPVSFTVRLRPDQTIDDVKAAAPSIAATMNVAGLQVTPLVAPQWVRVVLLTAPLGASGQVG